MVVHANPVASPVLPVLDEQTLYMVRADIGLHQFNQWMSSRSMRDPDYAIHCLLEELLATWAMRPFRLVFTRGNPNGVLYGYGTVPVSDLRDLVADVADPLQMEIMPPNGMQAKQMPTRFQEGKILGVELRCRPVRRRFKANNQEQDAFLVSAENYPKGQMPMTREEVYTEWLGFRLNSKGGAELIPGQTKMRAFRLTNGYRKLNGGLTNGPDVVLDANIRVTDSMAFQSLLKEGVGRHKAYGYGMLLLKPPHQFRSNRFVR